MDYASHAPLPSLALARVGHFRVCAGRPVIPFSWSTNERSESGTSCATNRRFCRAAVLVSCCARPLRSRVFAVTMASPGTYSLASRVAAFARLPRKEIPNGTTLLSKALAC